MKIKSSASPVRRSLLTNVFSLAFVTCLTAQNPGIEFSYIDSTHNPCENFYEYCNGGWNKTFELPASDARYGSFNEINDSNLEKIRKIYEAAATDRAAPVNTDAQRLRDFYTTAMDSAKADRLGRAPIVPQTAMIDKIKTKEDFIALKSKFDFPGINLLYTGGVSTDLKNSKQHLFVLRQAGYGLGDRDYYHEAQHSEIRKEYTGYLRQLFVLDGSDPALAEKQAQQVLKFETELTKHALTRVQMRDVEKMYNIFRPGALKELTPNINWDKYFAEKKIRWPDSINVAMPDYMANMSKLFAATPLQILKTYARAHLLMEAAPFLSQSMEQVHFAFRGKVMSGTQKMKPRWERVHKVMNASVGEIVSKVFVKEHFPPSSKIKVDKLIDNLILAYRDRIATRDWMSDDTKEQANRKLDLLIRKISYPDKWKDYTGLNIGTDSYWANVCSVNSWLAQDNLSDLGKPVDRNKWYMTPVTVNAYYNPTSNEITFPAAILQPPFFDPEADDAANYGTIGAIIGHELTHGFDDKGARFDADGNLKMWWTSTDFENFKQRTEMIVKQFGEYVALDTLRVNGSMTQGENIADLGGLTMAYHAYKKSLDGQKSTVIGGYTGEQRFFIAWAQGWKSKTRDQELRRLLTVDYHSPAYFRAFAPLTNMKEFHEAFGVKPGDKMYRSDAERVEIW